MASRTYHRDLPLTMSSFRYDAEGCRFALTGIMVYVAADAAFNPAHEGKPLQAFNSKVIENGFAWSQLM
jgi:hypothetical protein